LLFSKPTLTTTVISHTNQNDFSVFFSTTVAAVTPTKIGGDERLTKDSTGDSMKTASNLFVPHKMAGIYNSLTDVDEGMKLSLRPVLEEIEARNVSEKTLRKDLTTVSNNAAAADDLGILKR
jgi:hypothetical protein